MENRFDELAKALARGVSRREALRRFGGGVAGAMLASLGLKPAWGDPGGNSACAHFCHQVFSGGEAGQCTSQAAHGQGACPACEADVTRYCPGAPLTEGGCCPRGTDCGVIVGPNGNRVQACVCPGTGQAPCSVIGSGPTRAAVCCQHGQFCCGPDTCCTTGEQQCCSPGVCCGPGPVTCCGGACVSNCPSGQNLNPATCTCECPPANPGGAPTAACGSICCPPSARCVAPGMCSCTDPVGNPTQPCPPGGGCCGPICYQPGFSPPGGVFCCNLQNLAANFCPPNANCCGQFCAPPCASSSLTFCCDPQTGRSACCQPGVPCNNGVCG